MNARSFLCYDLINHLPLNASASRLAYFFAHQTGGE